MGIRTITQLTQKSSLESVDGQASAVRHQVAEQSQVLLDKEYRELLEQAHGFLTTTIITQSNLFLMS